MSKCVSKVHLSYESLTSVFAVLSMLLPTSRGFTLWPVHHPCTIRAISVYVISYLVRLKLPSISVCLEDLSPIVAVLTFLIAKTARPFLEPISRRFIVAKGLIVIQTELPRARS